MSDKMTFREQCGFYVSMVPGMIVGFREFINNLEVDYFGMFVVTAVCEILFFSLILPRLDKRAEKKSNVKNCPFLIYNGCVKEGLTEVVTEQQKQKALLIAQQMIGINKISDLETKIVSLFQEGKRIVERANQNKSNYELKQQKANYSKQYAESIAYIKYTGREKMVVMLTDLLKKAKAELSSAQSSHKSVQNMFLEKESDWATMGGIASGLAGPAAGLATASNIQQKNAAVRAHNASVQPMINQVQSFTSNIAFSASCRVQHLEGQLEKTKIKLVSPMSAKEAFHCVTCRLIKAEPTPFGAVTLSIHVCLTKEVTIFDNVDASIDGAMKVKLYQNGNKIGETELVLPLYGITRVLDEKSEISVDSYECYCVSPTDFESSSSLDAKFEPIHMWAIEK